MTAFRLPAGGRIDRNVALRLTFDGRALPAFAGDTLASALLAADEKIVARSFKYHRPRGIYAAGVEEPNALVHLRRDGRGEPNAQATTTEASEGMEVTGQNAFPNVRFDLNAFNQWLSPFIAAGFYYKTFIGPARGTGFWMFCEKFIRHAAGMGRAEICADLDSYEKVNAYCDVLVVGGGCAGLVAALAAGRRGARVLLAEQDFIFGGGLLAEPVGGGGDDWLNTMLAELKKIDNVRLMPRTTVFGVYDNNVHGAIEQLPPRTAAAKHPRQRYWVIRAKQTILATGAIERPLVFANNDIPGVMLASAARVYLNRYAVLAGKCVIVSTTNDSAYAVAVDLARAGAQVTLLDARAESAVAVKLRDVVTAAGVEVLLQQAVVAAVGRKRVRAAVVASLDSHGAITGKKQRLECDVIAVSGGWSPTLHLWSMKGKKPVYDEQKACFVPVGGEDEIFYCVGGVVAADSAFTAVVQGFAAGADAAVAAGSDGAVGEMPPPLCDTVAGWDACWNAVLPLASVGVGGKAFLDLQHDVTRDDIKLAHREGYVAVEHLKRYTTTGMAGDQGKTSNVNALILMASLCGEPAAKVGTTVFRPPYTPVNFGALAGREQGEHFRATRRTPMHEWHDGNGAVSVQAGSWLRPWYYPRPGEDIRAAYIREATHVRRDVGMVDVSTLGKIAVQGPDAAEFLNRVYVNGWKTLAVGRLRYGVMLREDGFVMDDGATARLGEHDYFMSTTTANAARVLAFAEYLLQTAWRDLRVHVTSVTDEWAALAIAGPQARATLTTASEGAALDTESLPNNHFTHARIGGVDVRIHRMSYSGELAYEVYVRAGHGLHVWETLVAAGAPLNLCPYGTEAMGALRIEKGHVAGAEIEGRTLLSDLGLEGFASKTKPFVGSLLHRRPVLQDPARPRIVGLEIEGNTGAQAGALLFPLDGETVGHGDGWVSSTTYSPALSKHIAIALLKNGAQRIDERLRVVNFVGNSTLYAKVVSHHFYDPKGIRQNA